MYRVAALALLVGCAKTTPQPSEVPPTSGSSTGSAAITLAPATPAKTTPLTTPTTLAALLGDPADPHHLGFEHGRVLGAQHDDFVKDYPEYVADPDATFTAVNGKEVRFGWIELPPTEYAKDGTRIRVTFGTFDELKKLALDIRVQSPAEHDAVVATVTAKWGAPKRVPEKLVKTYELRAADPRVVLEDRDETSVKHLTLELFY